MMEELWSLFRELASMKSENLFGAAHIHKVMLVDDSYTARVFIRTCFEMLGFGELEFVEARHGQDALEQLKKIRDVDLVVSDLNMPVMDGFELIRRIRTSPLLHDTRIIIISSASREDQDTELMKLGAAATLKKPISPERLMGALKTLKEDRESI